MGVTEVPDLSSEEYFLLFSAPPRDAHFLNITIMEVNPVVAVPKMVQL